MEIQQPRAEDRSHSPANVMLIHRGPKVCDHTSESVFVRLSGIPVVPKTDPGHHNSPLPVSAHHVDMSRVPPGPEINATSNSRISPRPPSAEADYVGPQYGNRDIQHVQNFANVLTSTSGQRSSTTASMTLDVGQQPEPQLLPLIPYPDAAFEVQIHDHRGFHVVGELYALPTMQIAAHDGETWRHSINPRLESEILHVLRKERCQLELLMCGTREGILRPTILLTCGYDKISLGPRESERRRRKIQKQVNKFQSLKGCPFPCHVIIDNIRLLAFVPGDQGDADWDLSCYQGSPDGQFCGAIIQVGKGSDRVNYCTLGGLITLESRTYGLTVFHPFCKRRQPQSHDGLSATSLSLSSESSSGAEFAPSPDSWSIGSKSTRWSVGGFHSGRDFIYPAVAPRSSAPSIGHDEDIFLTAGTLMQGPVEADCGLVRFPRALGIFANRYRPPGHDHLVEILHLGPSPTIDWDTPVFVIAGISGVVPGKLGQTGISLAVDNVSCNVTQVILERPLGKFCTESRLQSLINHAVPGDSGSWVVCGNSLLGYITAGRLIYPWAYMIPIESLNIHLRGSPILLPSISAGLPETENGIQPQNADRISVYDCDDDPENFYKSDLPTYASRGLSPPINLRTSPQLHTPFQTGGENIGLTKDKRQEHHGISGSIDVPQVSGGEAKFPSKDINSPPKRYTGAWYCHRRCPNPGPWPLQAQICAGCEHWRCSQCDWETPVADTNLEVLANALLKTKLWPCTKSAQLREDRPHELGVLRSEAKMAGIGLNQDEKPALVNWLAGLGEELDDIF